MKQSTARAIGNFLYKSARKSAKTRKVIIGSNRLPEELKIKEVK